MKQRLLNILMRGMDIVLPRYCAGCRKAHEDFCSSCIVQIKKPETRRGIMILWSYKDVRIRSAVHDLKYRGRRGIATLFAHEIISHILIDQISLFEKTKISSKDSKILLIPIPLTRNRLTQRGFNQSELIAREIKKMRPDLFDVRTDMLLKVKETGSQVLQVDRRKRFSNLRGAFIVKSKIDLSNIPLLLIDDVVTTGATIEECRKVLFKAGAQKVHAITVAG